VDVAIIGGTGKQGSGIALQLARAGHHVVIGSRVIERAEASAATVRERAHGEAEGRINTEAAAAADVVFVTVPHEAQEGTYTAIAASLRPGVIVVDTTNPSMTDTKSAPGEIASPQDRSAVEVASALLPKGVRLVAGFQSVSASKLGDLDEPLQGDVLLCGDDEEAKAVVGSLVEGIPNLRWVDAGSLSMARAVERLTALLISVNKRYGITGATVHLHGHETFGRPPPRN
jgi:NADPH-dependent F420 reductase